MLFAAGWRKFFFAQVLILINDQIKKYNHVLYCQSTHGYLCLIRIDKLASAVFF
ncbi:hypothetical protein NIES4102_28280 [Chondrocystis sp. NIES-4102]|nr:hypothetical protein NIES4102_28280 [Chondrocystis sp. NIES-4102]